MTDQIPIKIKGRTIYAKVGGYTGKTETSDPIEDILTGWIIWLPKSQIAGLDLRPGKRITVEIAGKKIPGTIRRWSRGARTIFLDEPLGHYISRSEAIELHEEACEKGYCV